ncbi:MAG TPA: AAA family ATPase [Caulobacteraceae bacterium]
MQPKVSESDPFDLDFETDDEFTSPRAQDDAWGEPGATAGGTGSVHPDPFVGLPMSADRLAEHAEAPPEPGSLNPVQAFASLHMALEAAEDRIPDLPGAEPSLPEESGTLGPAAVPQPAANPVGEMIAGVAAALGESVAPRITVNAFCTETDTLELVRKAAGDRRMERASTVVRPGGLAAAVEHYQSHSTPSLIIVEAAEPAAQLLGMLTSLAEVCDAGTKVIVIGAANDIALYRELMRQGVSDYLVPPLSTLQLIGAITGLYADPSAPFVGRQIAFCGAKGGAGASTLAHNVAFGISERMTAATVIVDLDLAFGTAGLNFNQDPLQGIADALSQPDRLDPVLMDRMMAKHTDHLSLFAAPATLDQDYDIASDSLEEVISKIRSTAPYVVLDLPHAWSTWKRRMLLTSDELIVVAEPDLASLRNAKNIVDLAKLARPNDSPPKVVLNRVGLPGRPEIPVKDFTEALGMALTLTIPFDAKVFGQAANNGQMIAEVAGKTRAAEAIDQLTRLVLNQRSAAPAATAVKPSVLASLFKRK